MEQAWRRPELRLICVVAAEMLSDANRDACACAQIRSMPNTVSWRYPRVGSIGISTVANDVAYVRAVVRRPTLFPIRRSQLFLGSLQETENKARLV